MKLIEVFRNNEFTYKNYKVQFEDDSDGFYWIYYEPKLPTQLKGFNKAATLNRAQDLARKAIDKAYELELQLRGNETNSIDVDRSGMTGGMSNV